MNQASCDLGGVNMNIKAVVFLSVSMLISSFAYSAESDSQPIAINLDEVQWGPPGGGNGVPLGTRTAQQRVDDKTGGITYYALFPASTHFDLHWHTHDEFVSVMSGAVTLVLGDKSYDLQAGAYVVIPVGMNHSWDVPDDGDVVILVSRAGPADFHFIEQ